MTSLHGYMDGSYNYQDLATKTRVSTGRIVFENTILYALFTSDVCEDFLKIVRTLDRLSGKFNSTNATFTVFVPLRIPPCMTQSTDTFLNEQFVNQHVFTSILPLDLLNSSPGLYLKQNLANQNVFVSSCDGVVMLNGKARLLEQRKVGTSILYLIDQPL
jgi:hypothetical protein